MWTEEEETERVSARAAAKAVWRVEDLRVELTPASVMEPLTVDVPLEDAVTSMVGCNVTVVEIVFVERLFAETTVRCTVVFPTVRCCMVITPSVLFRSGVKTTVHALNTLD